MNDDYLKKFGIRYLHYMAPIDNVPSILDTGILSYNLILRMQVKHRDIADVRVQEIRKSIIPLTKRSIHDYVPLYFGTQTPMQYVITRPATTRRRKQIVSRNDLVFLDLDASHIFGEPDVIFSDGNAAQLSKTTFYADPADLGKLDWETINCPGGYHSSSGKCYDREWKRKKSSEVLVPKKVPPEHICRIIVYDENAAEDLVNQVQAAGTKLNYPVTYDTKTTWKYYEFF